MRKWLPLDILLVRRNYIGLAQMYECIHALNYNIWYMASSGKDINPNYIWQLLINFV